MSYPPEDFAKTRLTSAAAKLAAVTASYHYTWDHISMVDAAIADLETAIAAYRVVLHADVAEAIGTMC